MYIPRYCFLLLALSTCTDPFVIETVDFQDVLVVESTITDEVRQQEVKISRTIQLEGAGVYHEDNAEVDVYGSDGSNRHFLQDVETGSYLSVEAFGARPGVSYRLKILTQDGRTYSSASVTLPPISAISRVYAELTSEGQSENIQVFVDTDNLEGDAKYFRFEYEETYKTQLPHPTPFDWRIVNYSDFTRTYQIELTPKRLDLACYSSVRSVGILQASTVDLNSNRLLRLPVRSINRSDPIIRDRYSILVKQYVQSLEAFTFYQTLKDLGSEESLLSQGQPGYIKGNIDSDKDPKDKVLGFFDVSSVSTQRIFFSYEDFALDKPRYFVECEPLVSDMIGSSILKRKLEFENYEVFFYEEINNRPIYHIAPSTCTKCSLLSTHIKPDFWED